MKISIITPTYNSSKTIRDTLDSIKLQTYQDIEVVIIDGLSSDNTLEIVQEYRKYFHIKVISEKDMGIYDAMNKGIDLAMGNIVHILNSDDLYFNENILSDISSIFNKNTNIDMVYGDIRYFYKDVNKTTRFWKAGVYNEHKLNNGWIIPHPGLFVRGSFYRKINKKFDIRLSIAADYEFILRSLKLEKATVFYLPKVLVSMRAGGTSSSHLFEAWKQKRYSWKLNQLHVPKLLIIKMLLVKIKQVLVKFYS